MPLARFHFFEDSNYIEAAFWAAIGLAFIVYAIRKRSRERRLALAAGPAFVLFGLSDVVEAQTGAWWRPWWLLAWKGACLAVFLVLLIRHYRAGREAKRRQSRAGGPPAGSR